ncbi:PEGA domain-containing protein [Candidatus Woesebacteria bacterium]|nr:PEGA domain-containing protein [Candidatus Woesebacteria bacterium]
MKLPKFKTPTQQTMRLVIFLSTLAFILGGTYLMIRYAQGYRPTKAGTIKGTGLLSANSFPTAAEVYINGKLTTATDNTLNLDPGKYDIEIKKDGYHTWSKQIQITAELVTATNAQLFPTSPSLEPLTYTGAMSPIPAPDGTKLAFTVASASALAKNGLYVQDLSSSPIALNKTARQIARTESSYDYTTSSYTWSPNGSEILVSFTSGAHVLLDSTRFNDLADLKDVTVRLPQILSEWELEIAREERVQLLNLPVFMAEVATQSATNLYFSPDNKKLLYQATKDLEIPEGLIEALPSNSTQTESRLIKPGAWYVYDLKEDKNFIVAEGTLPAPSPSSTPKTKKNVKVEPISPSFTPEKIMLLDNFETPIPAELVSSPSAFRKLQTGVSTLESITLFNAQYSPIFVGSIQWYPDSSHLIITTDNSVDITEYDGTNRHSVYGGPMDKNIIYPWPDGSKIITRLAFSEGTIPNLYTIKLK